MHEAPLFLSEKIEQTIVYEQEHDDYYTEVFKEWRQHAIQLEDLIDNLQERFTS